MGRRSAQINNDPSLFSQRANYWSALTTAIKGWGATVRFILIIVVTGVMVLQILNAVDATPIDGVLEIISAVRVSIAGARP